MGVLLHLFACSLGVLNRKTVTGCDSFEIFPFLFRVNFTDLNPGLMILTNLRQTPLPQIFGPLESYILLIKLKSLFCY